MKTVFGIFWHDLRQLARSPLAIAAVAALIVLSSACAWYAIAASWSPYSNAGSLKVAVVNEDAGVDLKDASYAALAEAQEGGRLDVGALLVAALEADESFDWRIVDASEGEAGLESGEFYAQFVVPETFTEDFLSVLQGAPEHPTVAYWANGKHAALALEAQGETASVVDATLNRAFSEVLADATADVLRGVAAEAAKAGVKVKSTGQSNLGSATSNVAGALGKMALAEKTIDRWGTSASASRSSLDALKSSLPGLRSSLNAASAQLEDVRSAVHEVESAYSDANSTTSESLSKTLSEAGEGVKEAADAIGEKQGDITQSTSNAKQVLQTIGSLVSTLRSLDIDSDKLDELERENEKLLAELNKIDEAGSAVEEAVEQARSAVGSAKTGIDDEASSLKKQQRELTDDVLPQLDSGIDSLVMVLGSLDGAVGSLDGQVDQAKSLLEGLSETLGQAKGSLLGVKSLLEAAGESLRDARSDLASVADSELMSRVSRLVDVDAKSYGTSASSPVVADLNPVYSLNSFGAGASPFYTCLAIWAGCLMLVVVLRLDVEPASFGRVRPWQGFLGRMMLFAALAVVLGVVVSAGDIAMGVEPVAPLSFVLASVFTALCFMSVVYALAATFRHVGKALAAALVVVQVPLASGMFPAQLMPPLYQALRSWTPTTYGMGALREGLAGFYGMAYAGDLLWLFACGMIALAVALAIRPGMLNASRSLGRNLADVEVFVSANLGSGRVEDDRGQVIEELAGRGGRREAELAEDGAEDEGEAAADGDADGDAGAEAAGGRDEGADGIEGFNEVDLDEAADWRNDAWGLTSWEADAELEGEGGDAEPEGEGDDAVPDSDEEDRS